MTQALEATSGTLLSHGISGSIDTAILLSGSAGSPVDAMIDTVAVPYSELPGFPSVQNGRMVVGTYEGARLAVLEGRTSFHETGDAAAMRLPLETVARMGARIVILATNALSLLGDVYPGSVAIISDHINFCGADPLVGVESPTRFVGMRNAYDERLRRRLKMVAATGGVSVQEGVYFATSRPSGETLAEARMAKSLGGDLLGHSFVPEVILARWLDMRVAAIAVVSGFAAGVGAPTAIQAVKDGTIAGGIGMRRLLKAFLRPAED